MAFTGYVFQRAADVAKVAERAADGPTLAWCQRHARRLRCLVTCGFVELGEDGKLFNAVLVVDRDGALVLCSRKTFLYETDELWATPGDGFRSWTCPWLGKTLTFGICMDINPEGFRAPFEAFELANHALEQQSDLVLLTCAWCDFEPPEAPEMPTLSYWATRMSPVIDALQNGTHSKKNVHFLAANRIGEENGTFFVGASCALSLKKPMVLAYAKRRQEALLRVAIPDDA